MSITNAIAASARFTVRRGYWFTIALLTIANSFLLGATSALAGISLDAFVTGSSEVAILNVIALSLLFWPGAAITVRRLSERQTQACWGAVLYVVTVFFFMATFFGKPFPVTDAASFARLLPTFFFMMLTAWIIVEFTSLHGRADKSAN